MARKLDWTQLMRHHCPKCGGTLIPTAMMRGDGYRCAEDERPYRCDFSIREERLEALKDRMKDDRRLQKMHDQMAG